MNGLERSENGSSTDWTESSEDEGSSSVCEFASSDSSSCSEEEEDCLDGDVLDALMELEQDDNFDVVNLL